MTNTINAADNPALANDLLTQALDNTVVEREPTIVPPSDTTIDLPGGYITATGEIVRTAEVRELTGKDEEAISKTSNIGKALLTILSRGVVSVGNEPADERVMDNLLSGDRETLLVGIIKATFGKTTEMSVYCAGCEDMKDVLVDLDKDIKVKKLEDPINDRVFIVKGKTAEITVQLPTGTAQKELILNSDKSVAELNTILLEHTVRKIGNTPVYGKHQVQELGIVDRKKILEEINKRVPGPDFEDVQLNCPDCDSEVTVSINLGSLFQF